MCVFTKTLFTTVSILYCTEIHLVATTHVFLSYKIIQDNTYTTNTGLTRHVSLASLWLSHKELLQLHLCFH